MILAHARQALLAAVMSLAAVMGSPYQAEAKKIEPPPPPPTAYDVRTIFCCHLLALLHRPR